MLLAAAAPAASVATAAEAAPASLAPLVAKVLQAYGGREALQRARAVRQEGTVTSSLRGSAGHLLRLYQRPGSLRVEIAYPGHAPEVRVVSGGRVGQGGYGDRDGREVTGTPMHAAMVLQAARMALPLSLAEEGAQVVDLGTVERGGKSLRALGLAVEKGIQVVTEIDPSTGLVLRSEGAMPGPGGTRIEFATEYADFRRVGGVLFPFREENWARGQHTGATVLSRIEVLAAAPDGAFSEQL